jgi:hypothetical protein
MIALLVPSRGRPGGISTLVDCLRQTEATGTELFVGLDDDDEHNYPRLPGVNYVTHERMNLAKWTNYLAEQTWDGFEILASIGDDHLPRTIGWDKKVHHAMTRMGGGLVYPDDGLQHESLATAAFWSSSVVRTLGWFCPPGYVHLYIDSYWLSLGRALGRAWYLPDVLVEHMHFTVGKAASDASYETTNSPKAYSAEREYHEAYMREHFPDDVARLKSALRIDNSRLGTVNNIISSGRWMSMTRALQKRTVRGLRKRMKPDHWKSRPRAG